MVGRSVKLLEPYIALSESLREFILLNFLIDVDLYTASSMFIYELHEKPVGILVLPFKLDPKYN